MCVRHISRLDALYQTRTEKIAKLTHTFTCIRNELQNSRPFCLLIQARDCICNITRKKALVYRTLCGVCKNCSRQWELGHKTSGIYSAWKAKSQMSQERLFSNSVTCNALVLQCRVVKKTRLSLTPVRVFVWISSAGPTFLIRRTNF